MARSSARFSTRSSARSAAAAASSASARWVGVKFWRRVGGSSGGWVGVGLLELEEDMIVRFCQCDWNDDATNYE